MRNSLCGVPWGLTIVCKKLIDNYYATARFWVLPIKKEFCSWKNGRFSQKLYESWEKNGEF